MENNELLTNEIENEVTTELEGYEVTESGSGLGRVIGFGAAVGAAAGAIVLAWKNKDKIRQHRISRLEKKLSKLYGEVEAEAADVEEIIEDEVVDTDDNE